MRICEECGHILENGEEYADLGGECYCRDCLHDMSIEGLMDLVGFPLRVMFGAELTEDNERWEEAL